MTRSEFQELAYNDPKNALMHLFDEHAATQATVLDISTHVQMPEEEAPVEA